MQMSDVIKVIGDSSLKEFPWGCAVKDTVNLFAKDGFRLNENSTGVDIIRALDSLGHDVRELILKATVDPSRCSVAQPAGDGMVLEQAANQHDDPTVELWRAMMSPKFIVVTTIVCVIVVIAMNMVFRLSSNGELGWKTLIEVAIELFNDDK